MLLHEKEGARLAAGILAEARYAAHGYLFTAEAQAMARALSALESVTLRPQRQALLRRQ